MLTDVGPLELEGMLERGWRRFGPAYFRPACVPCGECVPLRLPTTTFQPSRSQRRATRKCAALRCEAGPVRVDAERLALYAAWHAGREQARRWEESPVDAQDYGEQFGFPHACARDDDAPPNAKPPRLVAVGLCDETPHALSAIYFFHDPAYARFSPGVFHVINLVRMAVKDGRAHVYLGFRIAGCPSMQYKAGFRPHELLAGRPGPSEEPRWYRPDTPS